jgi:hypothetical protein
MDVSLCVAVQSSWHQPSHMTQCTHISCWTSSENFLQYVQYKWHPLISIFLNCIGLDTCWYFSPSSKFLCFLFPVCLAETIFVPLKSFSNFSYTENELSIGWTSWSASAWSYVSQNRYGDTSSGNIKSVDVFSVDLWSLRSFFVCFLLGISPPSD